MENSRCWEISFYCARNPAHPLPMWLCSEEGLAGEEGVHTVWEPLFPGPAHVFGVVERDSKTHTEVSICEAPES